MNQRWYFITLMLLLINSLTFADEGRKGQAGFQFLRIPMGARQIALGNSGIASATGAGAMYWNPAGVAWQKDYELQFSNVSWFGDVSYQNFAGVIGIGDLGSLGMSIQYLGYPEIIETTEEAPDGTGGTFKPYDMALTLNFSRQMTERVSFGVNVKYVNETIALVSAGALAFDIGLTYKTNLSGLQFGFAIFNYGTSGQFTGSGLRRFILRTDGPPNQTPVPVLFESDKIELPSSVQGGLAFQPIATDNFGVLFSGDYVVNAFAGDRANVGVEFGYDNMIFLRGGYVTQSDYNATKGGNANFGFGLKYGIGNDLSLMFDYAYADLGLLNNAQFISVGVQF